jgi:sulfate adenylyltransferase subunit 1
MPWYKGIDLLSLIENLNLDEAVLGEGLMQVQHVIRPKTEEYHDYRGFAGKIKSGRFNPGDEIEVFPSGQKSKIKSIEKYGVKQNTTAIGENATLLLEDEIDASRGNTLVIANNNLKTEKLINAKICWMQNESLNPNGKYRLQQGVYKCLIKVKEVTAKMDWESWKSVPTDNLNMNDIGEVALQLAQPLLHAHYHKNKNLGAFILIDSNTNNTAGVGFIQ